MTRTLTVDELGALFDGATSSIVRVETLPAYDAADDDPAELAAYRAEVRDTVARGVMWERLRVIDSPPTPYQRWELGAYLGNAAAGETIRIADRARIGAHPLDVWLFDDNAGALMFYDEHGALDRLVAVDSHALRARLDDYVAVVRRRAVALEDYLAASGLAVDRAS